MQKERFSGHTYHVLPNPQGGWDVKKAGRVRPVKHFRAKQEAVLFGRTLGHRVEGTLIIHGCDGRVLSTRHFCPGMEAASALVSSPRQGFGGAKDLIFLSPDFDASLDLFDT